MDQSITQSINQLHTKLFTTV